VATPSPSGRLLPPEPCQSLAGPTTLAEVTWRSSWWGVNLPRPGAGRLVTVELESHRNRGPFREGLCRLTAQHLHRSQANLLIERRLVRQIAGTELDVNVAQTTLEPIRDGYCRTIC